MGLEYGRGAERMQGGESCTWEGGAGGLDQGRGRGGGGAGFLTQGSTDSNCVPGGLLRGTDEETLRADVMRGRSVCRESSMCF